MKKRLISVILAALMTFSAIPSMAEETGNVQTSSVIEETVKPTNYAFAGYLQNLSANANRTLVNTSVITRENSNNSKKDLFDEGYGVYLYDLYYYPSFEIKNAYAVKDIKLNVKRTCKNNTYMRTNYAVSDKSILEGTPAGEYYDSAESDLYETLRSYNTKTSTVMPKWIDYTYGEDSVAVIDIPDDVISNIKTTEETSGKAVLNLALAAFSKLSINAGEVSLTVTYDNEKILKKEISQLKTIEDIKAFYLKYNDDINVKLDFFEDMSDVYLEIFEWFKTASEEEYTLLEFKNVFNRTVKNLVVEKSKVEISDFAGSGVEITSDGYMYTFDNEYTSEDDFSAYIAFDVKDTGSRFLFSAGAATITIGEGKMTISDGSSEVDCDISDNFCGNVALKFIPSGKIIAVASNSQERNVISINVDDFYVQTISLESDNNAMVSDFILQQYPEDFEKAATEALDAVSGLFDEGKRDEAIEAYDSADSMAREMAEGIAKKELGLYSELLLARVNYAKEQVKYENAVTAFENALITKKYEDYLKAEEIAASITDEELAESIKVNISQTKAEFAKIVPSVTSVIIEGTWKTGETLTAKVTMEDSCGNGDGYDCVWLVNEIESNQTGEKFEVSSSHAGKKIVLRVIPKNKQGTKGTPKESLPATIQGESYGGSGGSGGGGGGGSVFFGSVPPKIEEPKKDETVNKSFKDISGHWAEKTINNMMEKNIINGISKEEFAPDRNITKAEFTAIILRALNKETKKYSGEFKDVSASDWYADVLSTAYEMGLVGGSDGMFNPTSNISRQEMAKILVVAYEIKNGEINAQEDAGCTDFSDISDWAKDFVNKAYDAGLMKGDNGGRFNPLSGATRAEAATAVERFLNK